MQFFFNTLNYCRKNERNLFFCFLFFHIFVSTFLSFLAHSEHLSSLHDGMGVWYFALDSGKYHQEALNLVTHLQRHEWAEWWNLYRNHLNVKIISLTYLITGYHVPITYEIVNCFVWATSILLIHRVSKLLFINNNLTSLVGIMFFFQPSILISSTQLLRDPILILGFCFILYGFAVFSKQKTTWKWAVMIQIGIILLLLMREYLSIVVLACLLLPSIVLIKEKRFIPPLLFLIIPMVLLVFFVPHNYAPDVYSTIDITEKQVQTAVTTEKQIQTSVTTKKQVQSIYLNAITNKLSSMRQGFRDSNYDAGSRIDANHSYASFSELVKYFPRALQIGLLSPFPRDWFEKGQATGKIGRLLAGMEMIIWYLILSGFIFVVFKNPSVLKPFATVFLFSITLIILYAYVIPNFGTVYRMRQAYMMPFFLFGAYGLSLMRSNFLKKRSN